MFQIKERLEQEYGKSVEGKKIEIYGNIDNEFAVVMPINPNLDFVVMARLFEDGVWELQFMRDTRRNKPM
jgi:hypothetical protein